MLAAQPCAVNAGRCCGRHPGAPGPLRTRVLRAIVSGHMLTRRAFLAGSAVSIAAPLTADAQQATATRRIAVLLPGSLSGADQFPTLLRAFRDGLRDRGWNEGRNVVVDARWGEGHVDKFAGIISDLLARSPDVIVSWGPQAIRAAQQATTSVPIVMAIVHEPVAFGFVQSFARPGGNITGLAFQDSELTTKRLELLKQAVPRLRHVAVLWDPSGGGSTGVHAANEAAKTLGLKALAFEVRRPEEFEVAFASARNNGADAIIQMASPFLATYRRKLNELAMAHRLAMTCETRLFVADGCLMAYGPSFTEMSYRAAGYVDKILKGTKPAEIPVEQPTKFELVFNLKTAKALGLTLPPSLLLRADEVIE
jgi:putative tryptophan/tyrosine transport system substrate-binding protein